MIRGYRLTLIDFDTERGNKLILGLCFYVCGLGIITTMNYPTYGLFFLLCNLTYKALQNCLMLFPADPINNKVV